MKSSQTYLNFSDDEKIGKIASRAKTAKDEVELPIEDESELFLVGMHVQRRAFFVRLGDDSRLHEFADGGLHKLLRVCGAGVLLHLGNLVKRHCPLLLPN